jgi:hypothetical protein
VQYSAVAYHQGSRPRALGKDSIEKIEKSGHLPRRRGLRKISKCPLLFFFLAYKGALNSLVKKR